MIKRNDKPEIQPFEWHEKDIFEKTAKENFPHVYPFFLTALRSGLRLGELVALKPGDLDFRERFINVQRGFSKGKIDMPKSGKPRQVDMSAQLYDVLKQHLLNTKKFTLKKGLKEEPEFLFYSEEGNMIRGSHFRRRVFFKVLAKAHMRHIRIHDLRHTYATLRISKGDNIQDVSKQLGHHSVKFTLDAYSHWLPGKSKDQVDELDGNQHPNQRPRDRPKKERDLS